MLSNPRRKGVTACVVAVASLSVLTSTAGAATSKAEKTQNAAIKKGATQIARNKANIAKQNKAIGGILSAASKAGAAINGLTTGLAKAQADATSANGGVAAILSQVPTITNALLALQTGLVQAGAGLTSLQQLATSTEYGIGQVFIGAAPDAGAFLVTPDIPDAVQQAQTSETFVAQAAGAITVQVGVRSAESDGTGATLPAADCRVTVIGPGGTTVTVSKPNGALGGAPFYPINTKSPQTSTVPADAGFPFGPIGSDVLTNLTDTGASGNATTPLGAGTGAAIAGAGQTYTVTLDCVDLSPSTTDPTA
jgi:hypothetical protein